MSIKLRLILLVVTGLLTAVIMALVSFTGNSRMGNAISDSQVSMLSLRDHLEGDMMHDALRADVLSAILVGLGRSASTASDVRNDLAEHASQFRQVLADNLSLPLDANIKSALNNVEPGLPIRPHMHIMRINFFSSVPAAFRQVTRCPRIGR